MEEGEGRFPHDQTCFFAKIMDRLDISGHRSKHFQNKTRSNIEAAIARVVEVQWNRLASGCRVRGLVCKGVPTLESAGPEQRSTGNRSTTHPGSIFAHPIMEGSCLQAPRDLD